MTTASEQRLLNQRLVTDASREATRPQPAQPAIDLEWPRRLAKTTFLTDVVLSTAGSVLGWMVRLPGAHDHRTSRSSLALVVALPVVMIISIALSRAYERRFLGAGSEEFKRIFNACVRLLAAVAVAALAFKIDLSRGFVALSLVLATTFVLSGRMALRVALTRGRRKGRCIHRVVVVGNPDSVRGLVSHLRRQVNSGYQVVGACSTQPGVDLGLVTDRVPVLGGPDQTLETVRRLKADTVAVAACSEMDGAALRRLAWQLEGSGVGLLVAPLLADVAGSRIHRRPVSGLPLLHVEEPELSGGRRLMKGLIDRSVAGLALVLLSPLLLTVAVLVRTTSKGPAFFRQQRIGLNGEAFTMLKFRSMVVDAEARKADIIDLNQNSDGLLFKIRNDPRITPIGRWLRRFSIDELPQLINVVQGDMSLVGPRPPLPTEVQRYKDHVHRRLLVRPGLTGLWQVSGRSDLAWDEAVRLDLHYVENWSPALDFMILLKTMRAVVGRDGAY